MPHLLSVDPYSIAEGNVIDLFYLDIKIDDSLML